MVMNGMININAGLAGIGNGERLFITLMREWTVLRSGNAACLPPFLACAEIHGLNSHAADAVDSMLYLTQACLDRALCAETLTSRTLGCDERAVLTLLDQGRFISGAYTPRSIPHGLPGVLAWATVAVRKAFTEAGICLETPPRTAASCPFLEAPGRTDLPL